MSGFSRLVVASQRLSARCAVQSLPGAVGVSQRQSARCAGGDARLGMHTEAVTIGGPMAM